MAFSVSVVSLSIDDIGEKHCEMSTILEATVLISRKKYALCSAELELAEMFFREVK